MLSRSLPKYSKRPRRPKTDWSVFGGERQSKEQQLQSLTEQLESRSRSLPLPPLTPEMIAKRQARSSSKSKAKSVLTSKAAALASKALDSSASWLRRRNEQARETGEALRSLETREAQLKAASENLSSELESWKAKETQLLSELRNLNQRKKDANKNAEKLNRKSKKLESGCKRLKAALESLESA